MKILTTTLLMLTALISLSGCSSVSSMHNDTATACDKGIRNLNQNLSSREYNLHQANISRANSLLLAAQVQLQFAEYPGCLDNIKRAQDYLSGQEAAIISRL